MEKQVGKRNVIRMIGAYPVQVIAELRKTVTPTVREWLGWTLSCGVFVLLLMAGVSGLDFGLGDLVLRIFG